MINEIHENESGLMKYFRELLFEHEMDTDNTMPFKLWLCDKLKRRDDMLTMTANGYRDLKSRYEKAIGRASGLEEWLGEYRDQLKKENAYHKNTGIINAINELLNDNV
jgi:hypothetical protein